MQNLRWKDWLSQAERDLEWAKASLHSGFFAQTCFVCQQVGEKTLKALAYFRGADLVKSHSVKTIAKELGENGEIESMGQKLDLYYIPTRYPDAFMEGAPFEYFEESQAKEAIEFAEKIIDLVKVKLL
ncbi:MULTISPECIES: HEPN domain-containing protein [Leptospira]|uniref:HEPN domain protein n=1 Tax=Leptospira kirschneri str. 200802841 TaxID=1193047 RepID=A0A828Y3Q1_9LEPT|nr:MULTISPECIES: HEPN domain-containing protein [Leptospira]EKO52370.1 HEPN domain protein [Leptospira kirschneri str. 200802841]EMJ95774.1 HEPN domain protein [Leptospira kirschneri str. JB]EMK03088.1 HEPN domain protein [Leptospira kirschneri]EMK11907.1 HEPN domain protein [Leptospira kirschneri serovar Bim str. PUO 1247]EMN05721.1 HEPN domain protein [Leptospira kirschneri serovar Bim str. 1051]